MKTYDFQTLNDKEFEVLCADLISRRLGQTVERFKPGKDGGVDGRFFQADGGEAIIQCKHWMKSGLSALMNHLEKKEVVKVQALKPARYILATSLPLSRKNKKAIVSIFAPYIRSESDVLGNEDLNDILADHADVERRHYKLWITSAGVLSTLLNSAIVGRSREKLQDIHEASLRYVVTSSHRQALAKLDDMHTVIITGSPGVGKTYLAEQLCQYHAAKGFQFICIENSLNEAESVFDEEREQIFYYDDFLGGNFLQALGHHQDSHVINFIKRIKKDNSKRFVLTTRTNIFNRGKHLSDKFGIEKVDKNEFILSVDGLTSYEKAQILYNHLWHGNLDDERINELYEEQRYLEVIEHKNFNPRLISFITDADRLEGTAPAEYWEYLKGMLSNPKDVWRHVFDAQVDAMSRHIVVAICCNDSRISESELEACFHRLDASSLGAENSLSFTATMRLLTGALINRNVGFFGPPNYTLFNPSVADFVIANYLQSAVYIDGIVDALRTPQSLKYVKSLGESDSISPAVEKQFFELQAARFLAGEFGFEPTPYVLRLIKLLTNVGLRSEPLDSGILRVVNMQINAGWADLGEDFYEICRWCADHAILHPNDSPLLNYVAQAIASERNSYEELVVLSKLVREIDTEDGNLVQAFAEELERFLAETITEDVSRDDVLSGLFHSDDYNQAEVREYIEGSLDEFAIKLSPEQIDYVADCCDEDSIIESNRESAGHEEGASEWHFGAKGGNEGVVDQIADLFDRSDLQS